MLTAVRGATKEELEARRIAIPRVYRKLSNRIVSRFKEDEVRKILVCPDQERQRRLIGYKLSLDEFTVNVALDYLALKFRLQEMPGYDPARTHVEPKVFIATLNDHLLVVNSLITVNGRKARVVSRVKTEKLGKCTVIRTFEYRLLREPVQSVRLATIAQDSVILLD